MFEVHYGGLHLTTLKLTKSVILFIYEQTKPAKVHCLILLSKVKRHQMLAAGHLYGF
jgi:hypothetical protein